MELFACNPFRVLGIAVNSTESNVNDTYQKIMGLAKNNQVNDYVTEFDFPSLPPYPRTISSIKTAYAKLASYGYRCFAYAYPQFTVALNIDDVALNLRDITCYDSFLRCYMWLVVNDRDMEERQLWILLAEYMDKLIKATPDKFTEYFDHRFSDDLLDANLSALKSFHLTFKDIILLPLKEMVSGSMKYTSAIEILKLKNFDLNEDFPFIEIPQANLPKNGEEPPLLKLSVKAGEEYFDISTGKMVSSTTSTSANIESHEFEEAHAPLSAEKIITEDEKKSSEKSKENVPFTTLNNDKDPKDDFGGFISSRPTSFQDRKRDEYEDELIKDENTSAAVDNAAPKINKKTVKSAPKINLKKANFTSYNNQTADEENAGKEITDEVSLTANTPEENQYTDALIQMLQANRNNHQLMKDVDTKQAYDNGDSLSISNPDDEDISMDDINMKKYDSNLLSSPFAVDINGDMTWEQKYKNIKIDDLINPTMGGKSTRDTYQPDAIEEFKKTKKKHKEATKYVFKVSFTVAAIIILIMILIILDIL